jgi:hypothetical protein
VNADLALTFLAPSEETASLNTGGVARGVGGMPGGMISLSANGSTRAGGVMGIGALWQRQLEITNGRLLAPGELCSPGRRLIAIQKLWDSQDWALAYVFNKFLPPTPANGRVYLANYSGGVDVYGPRSGVVH